MASNDSTGATDEALEGSWSPKRSKATTTTKAASAARRTEGTGGDKQSAPDPEVLAGEIERTREELAETLDAIAEKVSPKRVASRAKKKVGDAVKDGAHDAVDSVRSTAAGAAEAVKGGVSAVKDKTSGEDLAAVPLSVAEAPVEPAPTPGALADAALTPAEPAGGETPSYAATLPPAAPSRLPVLAGAAAALAVVLLVMRRRRR